MGGTSHEGWPMTFVEMPKQHFSGDLFPGPLQKESANGATSSMRTEVMSATSTPRH